MTEQEKQTEILQRIHGKLSFFYWVTLVPLAIGVIAGTLWLTTKM